MTELINQNWISRLSKVDYAFQPIVNIHTGNTFGFEALLRLHREAGFLSIDDIFNQAYQEGLLHKVDLFLRQKVFSKFANFNQKHRIKLFYNLDNRMFDSKDYSPGNTAEQLKNSGYALNDICFEISEKHQFHTHLDVSKTLGIYRSQGYKIAVDDCGTGFSGLQLLYYAEPDYIKVDRFFIQNMENDPKKRLVVSTIVNFAHFLGSLVIAEGVETRSEYSLCKEIGCDMVQGYFIQRPTLILDDLKTRYEEIGEISRTEKRNGAFKDRSLIAGEIQYVKPVFSDCDSITLFDKFRNEENASFFPVVNQLEEPVGIVRDKAFKEYVFSKFGRQLLENPTFGKNISRFVARIPIADIHSSIEKLIETYTYYNNNEGLIMVDDNKYIGILSTTALLKIINEKNLTLARNQNPLSKLPGNTMIHEYFSKSLSDFESTYHLIYFDFDNFKPYNDRYGFRNGDRMILMFADLLRETELPENRFAGHIGGDDFFLGVQNADFSDIKDEMKRLAARFKKNAESFYDPETLKRGFMIAGDRKNNDVKTPLITVSLAILELPGNVERNCSIEDVSNMIAKLKKKAKQSDTGIASAVIMEFLDNDHDMYPVNCLIPLHQIS